MMRISVLLSLVFMVGHLGFVEGSISLDEVNWGSCDCLPGPPGPIGPTGPTGVAGATGPTGPLSAINAFFTVSTGDESTNLYFNGSSIVIDSNSTFTLGSPGVVPALPASTSNDGWLLDPGTYLVQLNLIARNSDPGFVEATLFGGAGTFTGGQIPTIEINSSDVAPSVTFSLVVTATTTLEFVVSAGSGDEVTLTSREGCRQLYIQKLD